MEGTPRQRAFARVESSTDAGELRRTAVNAAAQHDEELERAALRKLYAVLPSQQPGTLEHAVWSSIHALEDVLTRERARTTRLGRTRQKLSRHDEVRTVCDLVLGKASEGFTMLADRDMLDLTFEAVALRFPERFPDEVLDAARARLATVAVSG